MSKSAKPLWPDPMGLPFGLFGASPPPAPEPPAPNPMTQAFMQPFAQGLAGGVDMVKQFWGNLPGGASVPGFLLPTVDVEEIDKRIADLRAAESWLDVNLNMLRATIQGLEVQRHTIAAIRSLGALSEVPTAPRSAPVPQAPPTPSGLPPGWPVSRKAAEAEEEPEAPDDAMDTDAEDESEPEPEPEPPPPAPARVAKKAVKKTVNRTVAKPSAPSAVGVDTPVNALNNLAASNWLGYMQDQFTKVAQAALASTPAKAATKATSGPPATAAPKRGKAAAKRKSPAKKAARKR